MFDAPMSTPISAHPNRGVFAPLWSVLGWPARVAEARATRALLAELSEREWQDIRPGRQDLVEGADLPLEDPAEREVRLRAIRAWYGHGHGARAA